MDRNQAESRTVVSKPPQSWREVVMALVTNHLHKVMVSSAQISSCTPTYRQEWEESADTQAEKLRWRTAGRRGICGRSVPNFRVKFSYSYKLKEGLPFKIKVCWGCKGGLLSNLDSFYSWQTLCMSVLFQWSGSHQGCCLVWLYFSQPHGAKGFLKWIYVLFMTQT